MITVEGRQAVIPDSTFIHLNVVGTNINPKYWGEDSTVFRPERWLPSKSTSSQSSTNEKHEDANGTANEVKESVEADGLETTSFETSTSSSLITPVKGSYLSFSDGQRACPGRRFAQVESTAVLSCIFQKHSVELDVSDFASEEEVNRWKGQGEEGRRELKRVYDRARERAKEVVRRSEQLITLQMRGNDRVPVVFRRRGEEVFLGLYE